MSPIFSRYLQFLPLLTSVALGAPQGPYAPTNQSQSLQWSPCNISEAQTMPMLCATLPVPLDYLKPNSTEKLDLKLAKIAATKQPSRGSIQFNFGGPGAHGREDLAGLGAQLMAYSGGHYDLVAFDTSDESEKLIWDYANKAVSGNSSDTALGELWAITQNYVDKCKNSTYAASIGDKIGTAYIARDLISVVDALGEDGLLRFWGLSYGSALGATVAAMFPDRVDRIIIDAVLNPHNYWHYHEIESMNDLDNAFTAFLEACFEAGDKCALTRPNKTAAIVEEEFYEWVEDLKYHPISYPDFSFTFSSVRGLVFGLLYEPRLFALTARLIDGLMTGNLTAEDTAAIVALAPPTGMMSTETRIGITCSDKTRREPELEDSLPAVYEQWAISRLGGDIFTHFTMQCDKWHIAAKERYLGDFNVPMRHPVLAIGTTYDPITSWAGAVNASESLPGAVALKQNGFGHSSLKQVSSCTIKAIQAYLMEGTLPKPGTVCEVDEPLFSNSTWQDYFPADLA
ncbi:hypothetical protein DIS24_g12442 [Lasiodiplodia hormozganensis]|uniref:Tripeptidyl aminopeptidase n=1 Tax=Lasiodiplodia hormozganensis TaxID=869390 RepID=A0AA39WC38_9PEZI|nr:hypothetical protein DIS24_g12442 [Lasiodiplodia hormozganensis]